MYNSEVYHSVLHTTIVWFKVMNQDMFQAYLIPAGSFTLHVKMIKPQYLCIQVEIIAPAATLFDLSVYYFTHPSTSFKWEAIQQSHEEKENFVNLFTRLSTPIN